MLIKMPSLIAALLFLCFTTFCGAQRGIHLPQGVPLPPGAPSIQASADDAPQSISAGGPPAGPPGGSSSRSSQPAKPTGSSPAGVDLGNPSVTVCSGFGWTIYSGKCYKVVEGMMNWNQAVAACRAEDPASKLVVIDDEAENRKVGQIIKTALTRSRTIYHLANTLYYSFWIGMKRAKAGGEYASTWVDGTPVDFGNEPQIYIATTPNKYPWGKGQPSGTNKYTDPTGLVEICVHMFSADGKWNDASCATELAGGICEKSASL